MNMSFHLSLKTFSLQIGLNDLRYSLSRTDESKNYVDTIIIPPTYIVSSLCEIVLVCAD